MLVLTVELLKCRDLLLGFCMLCIPSLNLSLIPTFQLTFLAKQSQDKGDERITANWSLLKSAICPGEKMYLQLQIL